MTKQIFTAITAKLDLIADRIQSIDPRIALAIDKISDELDKCHTNITSAETTLTFGPNELRWISEAFDLAYENTKDSSKKTWYKSMAKGLLEKSKNSSQEHPRCPRCFEKHEPLKKLNPASQKTTKELIEALKEEDLLGFDDIGDALGAILDQDWTKRWEVTKKLEKAGEAYRKERLPEGLESRSECPMFKNK